MGFGEPKRGVGRPATGHESAADRMAATVARRQLVDRLPCADPARRAKLEADPVAWLRWYCEQTFTRKMERPHLEIIAGVMRAHEGSTRFVVAAERGIGKSSLLWAMILYLSLSGRHRFPVCVPWADKALKRAFRFWKMALCFNDRLGADYPEYCAPFRHSKGVPQRVASTTWRDTGSHTGAQMTVGEGIIVFPDRLGAIGGSTINGNPRGLNHPQDDGSVLRPSIVLLDDVQDRGTAKSPVQVADTVSIIDGDVAGCGEAGRDMPMLMACNCIAKGDVSEHYLTAPEWHALRVPCVEAWPAGWEDPKSKTRALWDDLHEKMLAGSGAATFYRKHKREITSGMKLSAPAAFKGAEGVPDAFFGVIRMYYRMGHEAFMAERQQQPVDPVAVAGPYILTPDAVLGRATKRRACEVPPWVVTIVASSDINPSYAMSTVVLGFGADGTPALLWSGIHRMAIPGNLPEQQFAAELHAELVAHGRELAGLPCHPALWAIDGGGKQFDAVIRFSETAARSVGIPAFAFTGRNAKGYKPYGRTCVQGQVKEQCHGCMDLKAGRQIKWVAWNADYWKEIAQRSFLGDAGAPGAMSLPAGSYGEYATQVCNERLLGKGEIGGQMIWNWHRVPGKNDFLDATAQGFAACAFTGIGTGGVARQRRYVETRRAKVKREV